MCVAYFFFFFFSFPFYTREFSLLLFFFSSWRQSRARRHTQTAMVGARPSGRKPRGCQTPGPGTRQGPGVPGWARTKAAGQGRCVTRHGTGKGRQLWATPPGVLSTPWHVVGTRRHTGDTMTCLSTTQDGPEPREGCEPPEHPRLPPSKVSGLVPSSGPSAPPAGPLLPAPGPAVPPCWVSSRSRSPALPELLLVVGEGKNIQTLEKIQSSARHLPADIEPGGCLWLRSTRCRLCPLYGILRGRARGRSRAAGQARAAGGARHGSEASRALGGGSQRGPRRAG